MGEDVPAQIGHHPLPQPGDQEEPAVARHGRDGDDDHQPGHHRIQQTGIAGPQAPVDEHPHPLPQAEDRQGGNGQRQTCTGKLELVRGQIGPQAAQGLQIGPRGAAGSVMALPGTGGFGLGAGTQHGNDLLG